MAERNGEMVFRPFSGEIVARSPEDLVTTGIEVHPDVIETTWGPEAIRRYKEATSGVTNRYEGKQAITVFTRGVDFSQGGKIHF